MGRDYVLFSLTAPVLTVEPDTYYEKLASFLWFSMNV